MKYPCLTKLLNFFANLFIWIGAIILFVTIIWSLLSECADFFRFSVVKPTGDDLVYFTIYIPIIFILSGAFLMKVHNDLRKDSKDC